MVKAGTPDGIHVDYSSVDLYRAADHVDHYVFYCWQRSMAKDRTRKRR